MLRGRLRYFVVIVMYLAFGYAVYSNTLNVPFLYDDNEVIVNDEVLHLDSVTWEGLKTILTVDRPVALLSFAFNYLFGGLDPYGYHVVNIIVHVLTAIGFSLFLEGTLLLSSSPHLRERSLLISGLAGLLWLVNPLQTQAVTYIVQRMASMAAMFYVWSLLFYLRGRVSTYGLKNLYLFLAVLSALLAFGTKQNTFTLPIFVFLYELIIFRRGDISFLLEKRVVIGLFVFLILSSGLLWYLYSTPLAIQPGSWLIYLGKTRLFTGISIVGFHITQLLLPTPSKLSLEHDFRISRFLFDPVSTFFAVILVGALLLYGLVYLKRYNIISFFIFWFLGNLALETFNPGLILVFEHRLYLPSMGFFAIAAVGLNKIYISLDQKKMKWLATALILIIIASFSINTYIRNSVWKDENSLWSDVVKKNPNLAIGYIGLGDAYAKDEYYEEALSAYLKAKSIEPRNPIIRYALGTVYFNQKRYVEAISEFSYLGSMDYIGTGTGPSISYYFSRIAKNYYGHGRVGEALKVLDRALLYDPEEPGLRELKEKMEKRTITAKEIMQK